MTVTHTACRRLLALLALLISPLVVQAHHEPGPDCDESIQNCDDPVTNIPAYGRSMGLTLPLQDTPRARELYAKMLPPGFTMPAEPMFTFGFSDVHTGTEVPGLTVVTGERYTTSWQEGLLGFMVKHIESGREGVYHFGIAADGFLGYQGRPLGYAKYYADMKIEPKDGTPPRLADPPFGDPLKTWDFFAIVNGEPTLEADFLPDGEVVENPPHDGLGGYSFRLFPHAHQGPRVVQQELFGIAPVPLSWILGQDVGPLGIPYLTEPFEVRTGTVNGRLDRRLWRADEDSPRQMVDLLWTDPATGDYIDLREIIDLSGDDPATNDYIEFHGQGTMIAGVFFLHVDKDGDAGAGGVLAQNTPPTVRPSDFAGCAATELDEEGHPRGGEWLSYGHDLSNTRNQPLEKKLIAPEGLSGLLPPLQQVFDLEVDWVLDTADEGLVSDIPSVFYNTPVVADGCLYNASSNGYVFALNAQTGQLVWKTKLTPNGVNGYVGLSGGGVTTGSLSVDKVRNALYVLVSIMDQPYVVKIDQASGSVIWESDPVVPVQADSPSGYEVGTYFLSSSVFFRDPDSGLGTIAAAWGGNAGVARYRGGVSYVDADTGEVLKVTPILRDDELPGGGQNFSGGTIWATGVVDPASKTFFVGTGNPGADQVEHEYTNAIVKFDLNRASPRFGQIVASYKGTVDSYVPGPEQLPICNPPPQGLPYPANSAACLHLDLDFGASPNLFIGDDGRVLVGSLQKSGVYHVAYADTMEPAWEAVVGLPCFPCNTASTAVVGDMIIVPAAPPRTLFALDDSSGSVQWVVPLTNPVGTQYQPVSTAGGIAWLYDGSTLYGWDAGTREPLYQQTLTYDAATVPDIGAVLGLSHPALAAALGGTSEGIAIARNTLYVAGGSKIFALRAVEDANSDGDDIPGDQDNCSRHFNPDQADADGDGIGDACEAGAQPDNDRDGDGVPNADDNCPDAANPGQEDSDGDGTGDLCDSEPPPQGDASPPYFERDCRSGAGSGPYPPELTDFACGVGFAGIDQAYLAYCAAFEGLPVANAICTDSDGDGVWDGRDNCWQTANPDQTDSDGDGQGDVCDAQDNPGDADDDGVTDADDQCPDTPPGTAVDAQGCALDSGADRDEDGVADAADNCPDTANADQADADGDGFGDVCDLAATLTADPSSGDVTNGPLLVNFSASVSGHEPQNADLTYTYYYGDGQNSGITRSNASQHSYAQAGSYTATVVIVDEATQKSASASTPVTTTTTVTVTPGPVTVEAVLNLSLSGATVPVTATLDASGSNAPDGAIYRFTSNGTMVQQGTNPVAVRSYALAGSYAIEVTVTDPNDAANTDSDAASFTIGDGQRTTVLLSVDPTQVQVGETVSFDASRSFAGEGREITAFRFDFGDGPVAVRTVSEFGQQAGIAQHAYQQAGSYEPEVTITDTAADQRAAKALVRVTGGATPPTDGPSPQPTAAPATPSPSPAPAAPRSDAGAGSGGALGLIVLLPMLLLGRRRRRAGVRSRA